jgi:hypothetical protein
MNPAFPTVGVFADYSSNEIFSYNQFSGFIPFWLQGVTNSDITGNYGFGVDSQNGGVYDAGGNFNNQIIYNNWPIGIFPSTETVVISSASTSVYGQTVTFTATITGSPRPVTFQEGDNILAAWVPLDSSGHASVRVASLPASAVPYRITAYLNGPGECSGVVYQTVSKAPLQVTADNKTRLYGQPNPSFTASCSGVVLGDGPGILGGSLGFNTSANPGSNVGSYAITLGGLTSTNYSILFVNGTLTIQPAPLTVVCGQYSRTYGSANRVFSGLASGIRINDPITDSCQSIATPASSVGSYAIVPILSDNGTGKLANYAPTIIDGTLTITPAPLIITPADVTRPFGTPNPTLTCTVWGIQNNDNISASCHTTATQSSPVGTYPITATVMDPNRRSANYDVQINQGTLTIIPAPDSLLVTSTADSGPGSLRSVLANAPAGSAVHFGISGIIFLTSGPLVLTKDVTIAGPGAGFFPITGNGRFRVFQITPGVTATLSRLTIENGDSSGSAGGGIDNEGTLTLANCRILGNFADPRGGGIDNLGSLLARNTIIAGNTISTGSGPDLSGVLTSQGHNLIGNSAGGSGFAASDLLDVNPLLTTLRSNGGPTQTMALLPGSPAVDAGANSAAPAYDQRGSGYPRIVGGQIDSGAFEAQPGPATHFQISAPALVYAGTPFDVTVTALDAYGHTATGYRGTVYFNTSDFDYDVAVPGPYTFTSNDQGVHTFAGGVILISAGEQILSVTDLANNAVSGNVFIFVDPAPTAPPGGGARRSSPNMGTGLQPIGNPVPDQPIAAVDRVFASMSEEPVFLLGRFNNLIATEDPFASNGNGGSF